MKDGRRFCSVIILQPRNEDDNCSFKCRTQSRLSPTAVGHSLWGVGRRMFGSVVCSVQTMCIGHWMWARLDSAGLLLSNMRMPGVFRVRRVCKCMGLRCCILISCRHASIPL